MDYQLTREMATACSDLHEKMTSTVDKMRFIDQQMLAEDRRVQFSLLTVETLAELPAAVRTYERFGRIFTLDTHTNIRDNLEDKILKGRKKLLELQQARNYLERTFKGADDALKEMFEKKENP